MLEDVIVCQLGIEPEEITLDSDFVDDLGADSLNIVELIMAFEKEFNVEIPDDEALQMRTVYDVINYIERWK